MDFYDLTVPQLVHTLNNVDGWLERANAHASDKQLTHDKVLQARLAPDQFTFVRQIQTATDNAKFIPSRLANRQPPPHPDTETSLVELRTRVAATITYLGTFSHDDLREAADRPVALPWMKPGQFLSARDYVVQFGLPNFYFHVVTAYSILRHVGVELGKRDYIGQIAIQTS